VRSTPSPGSTAITDRACPRRSAKQEAALLAAGHQVITYDRRGFSASSRPSTGYDFDTLAAELHVLLSRLNLRGVEDFRSDLATISIPVLIIHGDQDRVLPYEATSRRLPALLKNTRSVIIAGGPHAVIWTHADEVNQALLRFIGHPA